MPQFDWLKKGLGREGDAPQICPMCGTDTCVKGWAFSMGYFTCYSCNGTLDLRRIDSAA